MRTAAKIGTEQAALPWQKRVADLCTAARGPLAFVLMWLGIVRGKDGIQLAFILLLVAATLDTLDGYFARLSRYPHQTWIGSHDLTLDIAFSTALLFYLGAAGYLSLYLAAFYAGSWILILWNQTALSSTLAVLFQAPIYAGVVLAAVLHNINLILWITIWVGLMLAFAGKRFFYVRLPAFFDDLFERILKGRCGLDPRIRDRERVQDELEPGSIDPKTQKFCG